ncbi:BC1872 family protein [Shouchella clausii]|uniref:BC1872 family protein n=1 Tax=Shouchella clausii TaxID=79880 RepID=UPI00135F16ED
MPLAPKEDREWSPTQNIEQAFQVLEKVKCAWRIQSSERGYSVCLHVYNNVNSFPTTVQIEASELAEAICRAVLMIPDSYLILREEIGQ